MWIKAALASNGDYVLAILFAYFAVQTGVALFLKLSGAPLFPRDMVKRTLQAVARTAIRRR